MAATRGFVCTAPAARSVEHGDKARARGDRVGAFDRGVIAPSDDEVRM
jgi:hypothetical protein